METRSGFVWQAFVEGSDFTGASVLEGPLEMGVRERKAIFNLPNGFPAFILTDSSDLPADGAPLSRHERR